MWAIEYEHHVELIRWIGWTILIVTITVLMTAGVGAIGKWMIEK